MTWFRLYHEMIDDPKIRLLSPELRWNFIEILCISSKEKERGTLPGLALCAVQMRVSPAKAQRIIEALIQAGLIDEPVEGKPLSVHGWQSRQYKADETCQRTRQYRDRIRSKGETATGYTKHRAKVLERDGGQCVYCGQTENLCLDHLIPISRNGDSEIDNLVTACKKCNSGKSGRLPEEAGYRFANPITKSQYERVRHRLKSKTVTVTGSPVTVTVTASENRSRSRHEETERDPLPPKPQFAPSGGRENYTHRSARHAAAWGEANKDFHSDP